MFAKETIWQGHIQVTATKSNKLQNRTVVAFFNYTR